MRGYAPRASAGPSPAHVHAGGLGLTTPRPARAGGHGGGPLIGIGALGALPHPSRPGPGWRPCGEGLRGCGRLSWGPGAPRAGPQVVIAAQGAAAQPPSRRQHIVVQPAPQRAGQLNAPLQPTPQHLLQLLRGAPGPTGIMSIARPYAERDFAVYQAEGAQQLKPRGDVASWPVEDKQGVFKEVLLVATSVREASRVAQAALQRWETVHAVSVIALVQSAPRTQCSMERLLRALGVNRAELEFPEGVLHCQPFTLRGPWECASRGEVDPAPRCHTLRLRWRRAADVDQEDQNMLDEDGGGGRCGCSRAPPSERPPTPGGGSAGEGSHHPGPPPFAGARETKTGARVDTLHRPQVFARCAMRPLLLPNAGGGGFGGTAGRRCEASVVLPLMQAQAVVRASGKSQGITCRPWMQGGDSPLPGAMMWVRLPASARAPLPDLWAKLSTDPQVSGQFGGLIPGDQEGRLGVRIFGGTTVPQGVPQAVGNILGAEITARKVVVRVGGYHLSYGQPAGGWAAFQKELPEVFGEDAGGSYHPLRPPPALRVRSPHMGHHPHRCPGGVAGGVPPLGGLTGPRSGMGSKGSTAPPRGSAPGPIRPGARPTPTLFALGARGWRGAGGDGTRWGCAHGRCKGVWRGWSRRSPGAAPRHAVTVAWPTGLARRAPGGAPWGPEGTLSRLASAGRGATFCPWPAQGPTLPETSLGRAPEGPTGRNPDDRGWVHTWTAAGGLSQGFSERGREQVPPPPPPPPTPVLASALGGTARCAARAPLHTAWPPTLPRRHQQLQRL